MTRTGTATPNPGKFTCPPTLSFELQATHFRSMMYICSKTADVVQVTATSVHADRDRKLIHRHCSKANMAAAANSKSCWTTKKWRWLARQGYKSYCGSFVYPLNEVLQRLWMNLYSPLTFYVISTNLRRLYVIC